MGGTQFEVGGMQLRLQALGCWGAATMSPGWRLQVEDRGDWSTLVVRPLANDYKTAT